MRLLAVVCGMSTSDKGWIITIIPYMKAKSGGVNIAVTPKKESTKDGLCKNIQNTVEDGLRVRCDDVAALGKAPGDGVQEPEEDGPDAANQVSSGNFGTKCNCVFTGGPSNGPSNPKECNKAEGEVSPLVRRLHQCAHQAGYDHHLIDKDCV